MVDMIDDSNYNCKNALTFLLDISQQLATANDNHLLLKGLENIFQNYFGINNFRVFLKDENTSTLRDFVKSWIIVEKNLQEELVVNIFSKLKNSSTTGFLLNSKFLKFNSPYPKLKKDFRDSVLDAKNILYFPIYNEKKLIGVIEIVFDKVETAITEQSFFDALRIAITQINTVIVNRILNRQYITNIKFQNAIKSIAKLIENQFELNYILPIIGELIDRFVSEHLIYIFLKDESGEYNLFWPSACQDDNVLRLLEEMSNTKPYLISNDGKTGLFAIRNEDSTIGVIAASSNIDKLSKIDIDYLCQFSAQASITTQKANSYAQVLKYATLDALTGLNNRRQFEIRLKQEVSNARRNEKTLCCIMLDIDYFKKINDTWGHSAGDCVLKNVAKIVVQCLREYDIASRYGGEEFCILLPDTKLREAVFVAQRLREAVEKADINISDDKLFGADTLKVTISVGVSEYNNDFETVEKLHQCADVALYEAKKRGRNRVVVYDESLL